MPQIQKETVRNEIKHTALTLFATQGYEQTSMVNIAKAAGFSVGNVYRYFKSKQDILEELVPKEFMNELTKQLFTKIDTGKGITISEQMKDKEYIENSAQFIKTIVANRLQILVAFRCRKNEQGVAFKEEVIASLVQFFLQQFVPENQRESLVATVELLYRGLANLYMEILTEEHTEEEYITQLKRVTEYHVAGLATLIETK